MYTPEGVNSVANFITAWRVSIKLRLPLSVCNVFFVSKGNLLDFYFNQLDDSRQKSRYHPGFQKYDFSCSGKDTLIKHSFFEAPNEEEKGEGRGLGAVTRNNDTVAITDMHTMMNCNG